MTQSLGDKCIADIFTKGSHHRNLIISGFKEATLYSLAGFKQIDSPYTPGIPAIPEAYFVTPPPTVEHPERRHWHTGDTDMDESVSDESEREHPDDTVVEGTDLGKTEIEKTDDTDVNESYSGEKNHEEDEDEDHHRTLVPWNEFDNSQIVRALKAYYLRNIPGNRSYQCIYLN